MFRRVAHSVAAAEVKFSNAASAQQWEEVYFQLLSNLDFLPNSPTLMNAGTQTGQLSACFVLPVGDSLVEIFDSLKLAALIQHAGGGTGFSFSRLRPKGDIVASTGGTASGPVSFMRIFDCATEHIRLGGRRRGANMGVLRVDHPDIMEFIEAKISAAHPKLGSLENFNLSVAVTDDFMRAVETDRSFLLRHPKTGEGFGKYSAAELFRRIAEAAWESGDPGLLFVDAINRANPTPAIGHIEATNPCGEVPLLAFEACTLGSINLAHMLREEPSSQLRRTVDRQGRHKSFAVDWEKLATTTHAAVRFLDDVIEVGGWPCSETEAIVRGNRKIGLGVMGFAEMLIQLGLPYASSEAVSLAEKLMKFIADQAATASETLANERGVFPYWEQSVFAELNSSSVPFPGVSIGVDVPSPRRRRNATLTSIAPTGTIGIIANTSASIEPLFALAFHRRALDEQVLIELNPLFVRYAKEHGFWSTELADEVHMRGSLLGSNLVPAEVLRLFCCALEIAPVDHLRVQAAFQKHVDNAVSKTINLPHSATIQDVADIYWRAWQMGLKGVTVYRYGSHGQQVLELGTGETAEQYDHFARCDPHACKL